MAISVTQARGSGAAQLPLFRGTTPPEPVVADVVRDLSNVAGAGQERNMADLETAAGVNRDRAPQSGQKVANTDLVVSPVVGTDAHEWAWPDCATDCEYRGCCGYCQSGPPLHCGRYVPVVGTRQEVARELNRYLAENGHKGQITA